MSAPDCRAYITYTR